MVLTSGLASGSLHGGHGPLHATGVQELRKQPAKAQIEHESTQEGTMIETSNATPEEFIASTSITLTYIYIYINVITLNF